MCDKCKEKGWINGRMLTECHKVDIQAAWDRPIAELREEGPRAWHTPEQSVSLPCHPLCTSCFLWDFLMWLAAWEPTRSPTGYGRKFGPWCHLCDWLSSGLLERGCEPCWRLWQHWLHALFCPLWPGGQRWPAGQADSASWLGWGWTELLPGGSVHENQMPTEPVSS